MDLTIDAMIMKTYKEIPFYANTPDDTHCFQASLRMILKYFYPSENYSWEELDKITAKVEGLWTWPTAGLIWLQEKGLEIKNIEPFDYSKFVQLREKYLLKQYGEEVGNEQIKHSDINQEVELAKKFVEVVDVEQRVPGIDDIKRLLLENYVVIVNVNSVALDNRKGYAGHFVVIKGFDGEGFVINDPGSPGIENRNVDFELFEKAWSYPNEKSKNIMAFRKKP